MFSICVKLFCLCSLLCVKLLSLQPFGHKIIVFVVSLSVKSFCLFAVGLCVKVLFHLQSA